jgi:hypothetical protein
MDIEILIIGLVAFALGLIGLIIKSNTKDYPYKSYTGAKFLWSNYVLLGLGLVLIIWSLFS